MYDEEGEMEYSLDHEDSMELQMVEFVHTSTKKARDVKRSYGQKNWQLPLEVEHLQGVVLYEWKCVEWHIDPLDFEAH